MRHKEEKWGVQVPVAQSNREKTSFFWGGGLLISKNSPLICVPKSILQMSSYCNTVVSPAFGV